MKNNQRANFVSQLKKNMAQVSKPKDSACSWNQLVFFSFFFMRRHRKGPVLTRITKKNFVNSIFMVFKIVLNLLLIGRKLNHQKGVNSIDQIWQSKSASLGCTRVFIHPLTWVEFRTQYAILSHMRAHSTFFPTNCNSNTIIIIQATGTILFCVLLVKNGDPK